MTAERERTATLPPRPVVRTAWVLHRALYRLSGGRIGLRPPEAGNKFGMMRLRTVGRRSGEPRVAIVGYLEDGPNLVTLAMNGWAEAEPAWWLNLQAQPDTTVELKDGLRAVRGRAADGEERDRLWARWRELSDDYDAWAARAPDPPPSSCSSHVRSRRAGSVRRPRLRLWRRTFVAGSRRVQSALSADSCIVSSQGDQMSSPKQLARIAGVLYLIVGVFGGFAIGYVTPLVYAPGDALTTAGNVSANAGLVRASVLADLLQATVFVFLAMVLFAILKEVNRGVARAMVILVAIATAVMCLNEVFQIGALLVSGEGAYATGFGATGADTLVLLLMDLHHYGFLIAQIFFGLWLIPLGYLAYTSDLFPRALGVVLVVGGSAYLVDLTLAFVAPDISRQVHGLLAIPPTIAEVWTVLYLLVKGVRSSDDPTAVARRTVPAAASAD